MSTTKDTPSDIYVWDWVVRVCHWGIVAAFITNYFIVEPGRLYHEIAGYIALALIISRVVWGFYSNKSGTYKSENTSYASFSNISLDKQTFLDHVQHLKQRQIPTSHGHNPFGWLMVFAVIALMLGLGITGFMMEEIDAMFGNSTLEWAHSIMADVLYACVLVHIAAVLLVQYVGNVQLIRPMLTGWRKR
ncbi:cytochrome b/b6 domain-containing protein [Alteromonas sp. IB21]|uniref:cytochrome b/b6 domain-containing protein n=1 Tax=Alteromonas sp. IB21 TaxID=2779369 RepID=UPI0018E75C40|nr:cytochrome b/b6 domain-containing protein [Alteromonas sp. IB21]MBJ2128670.1 cytochrome b/b6 domain-containing protein [Alteromonas sp. IB21]